MKSRFEIEIREET